MSRRTTEQKRRYELIDRGLYRYKADFERQRIASEAIAKSAHRPWGKRTHAIERAAERHGVVIDLFGLRIVERRIETGRPIQEGLLLLGHVAVDHQYRRTSIWLCVLDGKVAPIVFDHDSRAITTVLPRDANILRMDAGQFTRLAGGGTKAGREYWWAIQ